LATCLERLGVNPGDSLLVHSSLKAIGTVDGGADTVIDTLLEVVGPDGLIAVPTHTWDVVNDRQPVWHETLTPSHVGALTNLVRQRPGAVRSIHPTHSVAAISSGAHEFCAGHENDDSPCSPTSPYGKLLDRKGKILLLGVDLTRCTFIHCLEEIAGLGEIWSLTPRAQRFCIRTNGEVIPVMARAHKDYKSYNYGRAEAELAAAGILTKDKCGNGRSMLIDTPALADHLVPRMKENPKYFW
jgi:aminoglycoside 3-N-acetyltransferase